MPISSVKLTIDGTQHTLSYNASTEMYEGTITSPSVSSYSQSGHYYGATITVTDTDGNSTTLNSSDSTYGQYLRLFVTETVTPSISLTYPQSSDITADNTPTFLWDVIDNGSGVNPSSIGIKIDSDSTITGDSITKTAITGGYTCSYTPSQALSDGSHSFDISAQDNDGNLTILSVISFIVDTTAPTLTIISPVRYNTITKVPSITIQGTSKDTTSGPPIVTIQLNSGTPEPVDLSNNAFVKTIPLAKRENIIIIAATDQAGNQRAVARTVTVDTLQPVFGSVTINPNPVAASASYLISISVSDPVTVTAYLTSSSGKYYTTSSGNRLTIDIH